MRRGWLWGIALYCVLARVAGATEPDVDTLIRTMDQLYRADSSYARMEMRIVNPNWERTMTMDVWTTGMKNTFIRILSPAKDRGIATLRVDNDMWNYFPKIDKVMKVPPSMMMGSWMGSDFTNDDLVKETTLLDDYDAELLRAEDIPADHYRIRLVPKAQTPTVWGKIILEIQRDDLMPIRETYFDEKGTAVRRIDFKDTKSLGGRTLPAVMELTPLNKPGNQTIIEYLDAQFNQTLPADIFSLRNLQKKM